MAESKYKEAIMKYIPLIGRILFSLIFLVSGSAHFSKAMVDYASAQEVPMPEFLVPFSGIMAILGALSIILGYKAKWGAWLLMLFLVPVTFMMHNFWAVTDPAMAQIQQAMFMKNISMLGCALLITYFGSGPLSLDNVRFSRNTDTSRHNGKKEIMRKKRKLVHEPF